MFSFLYKSGSLHQVLPPKWCTLALSRSRTRGRLICSAVGALSRGIRVRDSQPRRGRRLGGCQGESLINDEGVRDKALIFMTKLLSGYEKHLVEPQVSISHFLFACPSSSPFTIFHLFQHVCLFRLICVRGTRCGLTAMALCAHVSPRLALSWSSWCRHTCLRASNR